MNSEDTEIKHTKSYLDWAKTIFTIAGIVLLLVIGLKSWTLSMVQTIDFITKATALIIYGFVFKMHIKKEGIALHWIVTALLLANTVNILTFFGMIN